MYIYVINIIFHMVITSIFINFSHTGRIFNLQVFFHIFYLFPIYFIHIVYFISVISITSIIYMIF